MGAECRGTSQLAAAFPACAAIATIVFGYATSALAIAASALALTAASLAAAFTTAACPDRR